MNVMPITFRTWVDKIYRRIVEFAMNNYLVIILGAAIAIGVSCAARPSINLGGGEGGASEGRPCMTDDDCGVGSPCAGHDVCIEQSCFPGPGLDLLDDKQCTDDVCDLATGVVAHPPVDVDDGNACTVDGCTEGVGIWHTRVTSTECDLAVDCYYFPKDTESAGQPCVDDTDCVTHNLCITSVCDAQLSVCRLEWVDEGSPCPIGGTCDIMGRCCLKL